MRRVGGDLDAVGPVRGQGFADSVRGQPDSGHGPARHSGQQAGAAADHLDAVIGGECSADDRGSSTVRAEILEPSAAASQPRSLPRTVLTGFWPGHLGHADADDFHGEVLYRPPVGLVVR